MKEYRIIRTKPTLAIVNIKVNTMTWVGYTEFGISSKDLDALRATYPEMEFEVASYVELDLGEGRGD